MHKFIYLFIMAILAAPAYASGNPAQECGQDEILGGATIDGATLKDIFIEEVAEIPSEAVFTYKGQELRFVGDPGDLEKWFNKKKGKKFRIAYELVYGFLGDSCDKYERIKNVEQIK